MKKALKIAAYFILAVIGLILLMVIFTQTVWFKNIARNKIETIVNEQLNGMLNIGEIKGTIFGGLIISDIRIEQNNSTLLYCKEINLDYNLLGIFSHSIKMNSVIIDSIFLRLNQIDDSTWNVMQLVKLQKEDTVSASFDWNIDVDKIKINNSNVYISTIDTASLIPHKIKNINFEVAAFISPESKQFNINHFAMETENPDFKLEDILLNANLSGSKLDIPSAVIKTSLNKIEISGEYYIEDTNKSIIHIETDPIQFDEFKEFLPNLKLNGNPTLNLVGEYFKSNAEFEIKIIDKSQTANLKAKISGINTTLSYNAQLYINNIDAGYWLNDTSKSTNINGTISLIGSGISIEKLNLISKLKIYDSELLHRKLDSMNLNAEVKNDNIQLQLKLISEFGQIDGNVDVAGYNDVQRFKIESEINKLNMAPLLLNEELQSNLNLTIAASGNKFDFEKMNGNILLLVDSSSVSDYAIDTIKSKIKVNDGVYFVDEFKFSNKAVEMNLEGSFSPVKQNNISFTIKTKDVSTLEQLKEYDNLSINGEINGKVKGVFDSLKAVINYDFLNFSFKSNSAEKLTGSINLTKINELIEADINSRLENINISEKLINKVELDAQYADNKVKSDLNIIIDDDASAEIQSVLTLDSTITLLIPGLKLNLSKSIWQNQNDSIKISIGENNYGVENLNLSNGDQSIKINGNINQENNDLKLSIENLNIDQFLNLVNNETKASGIVDAELNLGGSLAKPDAIGKIKLSDISYDGTEIGNIKTDFKLKEEKLTWDFELDNKGNKIISNGFVPFIINADSSQSVIPGNEQLSINLIIDSLDLAKYSGSNNKLDKIKGVIKTDIKLSNTLNELNAAGFFKIANASIESEAYGIAYDKININIDADSQKYYLREFEIVNDEGTLNIDGFAGYSGGILAGKVNQLKIDLTAHEFEVAKTKNYEAKIDGQLNLRDKNDEAIIAGNISILRSKIYLPYFTDAASDKDYIQNKPILIKELQQNKNIKGLAQNVNIKDTVKLGLDKTDKVIIKQPLFIKKINGKFSINIPKNTWITSPEINVELSGNLDVVKRNDVIELFGNINTVRGQFEIYGKQFSIVEGNIIFNGSKGYNPELNILLKHMFRGADRSKKYLELSIKGTAQKPKFAFSIDNSEVDEGNAVSYLMFGKSLAQLNQSQRTGVGNSETDIAKTLAGNFLAPQLSSTLGDALGLDVIEISGSESWKQANLTAGKYLNDDLYVSYERGIGSTETNEVNSRIVTLEYQLTKLIYLQLVEGNDKTAGFDIIFKFDWQ